MRCKVLFAACASIAALALAGGGEAKKTGSTRSLSQNSVASAAQQHPKLVEEFGGEETGPRAAYIRSVGSRVASQTNITGGGNAFRITTLNSAVLNAFAVPGGYLYITRQLVGLMNDEAELASVLGHEAGHIAARHNRERQRAGILSQLGAVLVGVVTGSGELAQLAGQVSQGMFLKYSREQEFEADDLGVRYIAAAGYDPMASATFLNSLGAATSLETRVVGGKDERTIPSWARTHPLSADRVSRATRKAQATGKTAAPRNRDQFLTQIDGMLVDDDPRQGVIDGRNFLHPDLRLKFSAPQGYGMQNGTRTVGVSGTGGQAQFGGGKSSGSLGSVIDQVYRGIAGGQSQVRYSQPQSTTINGIPAQFSTARVQTQQGMVDLSVIAYQWDSATAYYFMTLTPAGSGFGPFESMIRSVTRLSPAEAAAIRPRVIDVVTVKAGDTLQSLSARMAHNDHRLDRFLVLNGLQSSSRLVPGQKVKLVVYGNRS